MNNGSQNLWKKFEQTGKVNDYLKYKAILENKTEIENTGEENNANKNLRNSPDVK